MYDKLPESLKTEMLVRSKEVEDDEVLKQRMEMTKSMSPAQLGEIRGFSDFPVPTLRKKKKDQDQEMFEEDKSKSKENLYEKLPEGLKTEMLVRTKVETDEQTLKERQELTRAKSPAELGKIRGFSDIPLPSFGKKKEEKASSDFEELEKSKSKENLYDKLPDSLKTEMLVRSKEVEDDEVLKERQRMTSEMSPAQLSEFHGLSDFPIPTLRKKKKEKDDFSDEKSVTKSRENLYQKLPDSLKTEVLVKSKVVEDDEELKKRQEMTRSMSPAQLAEFHSLSDFPLPSFGKKKKESPTEPEISDPEKSKSRENLYQKLPDSLKTEMLVRSKEVEDDEVLRQRQEMTRSMSPAQLGEIRGFSDIPIPTFRKKKKEEPIDEEMKEKSKSKENLYARLPDSLKAEVFVKSKVVEDDDELKRRQEMTRAMSPAELGEIRGFSDIPIPTFRKKKKDEPADEPDMAKAKSKENLYERLPESLKTEMLVRSKEVEDDEVLRQRQEMTRAMSPAQLGEIRGFSDFPIPTLMKKKKEKEGDKEAR